MRLERDGPDPVRSFEPSESWRFGPRERRPSSPVFQLSDAEEEGAGEPQSSDRSVQRPPIPVKRKKDEADSPEAASARERLRREVFSPYLHAVQATLGANTVCLLRQDDNALKYQIEGIVSKNAYARSKGYFTTRVPLLTPAVARRPVQTFRIGEKGIPNVNLGYYVEPIAVRQIAVAAVPQSSSGANYMLLADTMEEAGLSAMGQHALLAQFAGVLGSVLDGGEAAPGETVQDVRPRREIIAEEMKRARSEASDMALVLVYLNAAEHIAEDGDESVNEAEAILEGRLRELVQERRVEHFGELIYAVFYHGAPEAVEEWVLQLQEELREPSGPLEDGVSIGIAVLRERHENPEALRTDAIDALREAYETGACTILE